jgi:Flp pilus assembly pilin Flp
MFRDFLKNKKAQNTAEYALLIALVVAGIIAMQTYAQRALQARVKDASSYMTNTQFNGMTASQQYEPYYMNSQYDVSRNTEESKRLATGLVAQDSTTQRTRSGAQTSTYNGTTGF